MTVKKAHLKYGIPESRVRNAIHKGWIDAKMAGRRYEFSKKQFKKNFKSMLIHYRDGRAFFTETIKEYRSASRSKQCFETNAAADEFEKLINK